MRATYYIHLIFLDLIARKVFGTTTTTTTNNNNNNNNRNSDTPANCIFKVQAVFHLHEVSELRIHNSSFIFTP